MRQGVRVVVVAVLAVLSLAADKLSGTPAERRRIEEENKKLVAEREELAKDVDYLMRRYGDQLVERIIRADGTADKETRLLLAEYELNKLVVPLLRTYVLSLNEQVVERPQQNTATTQPAVPAEELRLLRLEVARLRAENADLRKAGEGTAPHVAAAAPARAAADGGGFEYSGISFTEAGGLTKLVGEATNRSGKSYQMAMFKASFYDADKKLLGTADVLMFNLGAGQQKSFDAIIQGVNTQRVKSYKIQFESGL